MSLFNAYKRLDITALNAGVIRVLLGRGLIVGKKMPEWIDAADLAALNDDLALDKLQVVQLEDGGEVVLWFAPSVLK